jgi:hypothetical protein
MHDFPGPRGLIHTHLAWRSPTDLWDDEIVLLLVIKNFSLRDIMKRKRFNFTFGVLFQRYGLSNTISFEYLNNFLTVSH